MSDVTQILSQIESGDPKAAEQLLPLVYSELRKLAAAKLAQEKPGQALQSTAFVHDAGVHWLAPILSVTKASIGERTIFLVYATTFYVRSCDTISSVVELFFVTFDVFWEG